VRGIFPSETKCRASGNDLFNGLEGDDKIMGGSGSDYVFGDGGSDLATNDVDSNIGVLDYYSGGRGIDALLLRMSPA